MSKKNRFTNFFVFSSTTGELLSPPTCKKGEEVIPYFDQGSNGGTFWAVLPRGCSLKESFSLYREESSFRRLRHIGWHLVPTSMRPAGCRANLTGNLGEEWEENENSPSEELPKRIDDELVRIDEFVLRGFNPPED